MDIAFVGAEHSSHPAPSHQSQEVSIAEQEAVIPSLAQHSSQPEPSHQSHTSAGPSISIDIAHGSTGISPGGITVFGRSILTVTEQYLIRSERPIQLTGRVLFLV
jgi:hypothetical protein